MKKILVVNVNWLGDVILSLPIFKALKEKYPQSTIVCLAVGRVKNILESCFYVDEIIEYDEKGKHRYFFGKWKIVRELRKRKFDSVFLLHRSWTRAFLVYLANIPIRVGYDTKKRGKWLTHKVQHLTGDVHRSDYYLNVIESYGFKIQDRCAELSVSDSSWDEVRLILQEYAINDSDSYVIINTGGNWDLKRWPAAFWADLIKRLVLEFNQKVIIPGAPKDILLAQDIANRSGVNPIVLAGKTNIKQLLALLKRADFIVSADSGPIHMASSVGTQCIGIFGPTRPEITGPRGRGSVHVLQKDVECNRKPCYFLECPDNVCMKAVTVEDVINVISDLLKKSSPEMN